MAVPALVQELAAIGQEPPNRDALHEFTVRCRMLCPKPDPVMGIKPHSDGTVITVLLVDDGADRLQVLRDGVWYSVPSSAHTLLINVGESMEVMSNGMFRSPVHRVVTNAEKERISLAMFYALDPEKVIEPAAGLGICSSNRS
ncbi:hypothetical protein E2562_033620 [Oryza meyeriana var. granulata]|uniref:Fe2OG dioxygenase domain-containing protein n=1 Tax=Oryza meyeriana var. granulata TaxID=110450 RepID=A0A6G1FET7_9ORYZ|nr:hypothetical protein E2562_033620 [Oryza meyeriana var. granulata]